jgi:hypothetical protein
METMTRKDGYRSPASKVMNEAIELGIEERSPYPERSAFVDADTPHTQQTMERAAKDGYSIVLVSPDCSTRVIAPEEVLGAGAGDAA